MRTRHDPHRYVHMHPGQFRDEDHRRTAVSRAATTTSSGFSNGEDSAHALDRAVAAYWRNRSRS